MKKGFVDLCVAEIVVVAVTIGAIVYLPFSVPKFRVRKAVEKCEAVEKNIDCKAYVDLMSKEEVLDYIKDDEVTGNQGNF